jgi:hypothetical protein
VNKTQQPSAQATAEGFVSLLRSQTGKVRREVVLRLLDEDLREDVEAALLGEERQHEKKRPFAEYLREPEAPRS